MSQALIRVVGAFLIRDGLFVKHSLPARTVVNENSPQPHQPIILRQHPLVFAQLVLTIVIGLFGAMRFSALFEGRAALFAMLGWGGLLAACLHAGRLWPRTFQTLTANENGVSLKFGRQVQELSWSEMTALVLAGSADSGRPTGITVKSGQARSLILGGAWSMKTDRLLRLLSDRCQASTGRVLPISGEDPRDRIYGWFVVALAVVLLIPIVSGIYFVRLSSHRQAAVLHSELREAPK